MELPQPQPYADEGRKLNRDFLSLYSVSSFQRQDPTPSQGFYLQTHDFLQPLELAGKNDSDKEAREISAGEMPSSIENVLPGGIGTYSMSHLPSFGRAVVKPESGAFTGVEETNMERNGEASNTNSNCSSYNGGGGFKLCDESAVKETSTAKFKMGQSQMTTETSEKFPSFPSGSSGFGSMASSRREEKKKGYGFMEMLRRVKGLPEDEDEDDDDVLKKESSSHKDVGVRIEVKGNEQKANTPRSKHSATEQRRRSKINNRFQVLREIIPHSDQKRDKASFLLETIEYIQCLQEKLLKYEAAFPGWNQDSMKFTPWVKI